MILGVIMHEVSMNPNIFVLKATEMKATFGYSISAFRKVVELLGRKKIRNRRDDKRHHFAEGYQWQGVPATISG